MNVELGDFAEVLGREEWSRWVWGEHGSNSSNESECAGERIMISSWMVFEDCMRWINFRTERKRAFAAAGGLRLAGCIWALH